MPRYFVLAPLLLFISAAAAMGPQKTEFVSGEGFLRSSFGIAVEFAVEASQLDPNAPEGWMAASFFSFPQHLFMTLESTELNSVQVDRQRAEVSGAAMVVDARTGFEGVVDFSAVFEDIDRRRKNQPQNDAMILTLFLPSGTETFAGSIVPGGVEVGTRRR